MSEALTIRRVTADDFDAVAALLVELGRPAPTVANRDTLRRGFESHATADNVASLIALRGGKAVGALVLVFRDRLNWTTREAWIPDLVVTAAEHGRGVGPALLREAVAIARERGCHRLTLESGYQRQRAHRFYEREGMTDAGKYFILDLA